MSFRVSFSTDNNFTATFNPQPAMSATFGEHIEVPVVDYYNGEYSITPGPEQQTIPIVGKTARRNITVDPIPSNYGLITWNGSTITVS